MRRGILFVCLILLLTLPVQAQSIVQQEAAILGADQLYDGLDAQTKSRLQDIPTENTADFGKNLWKIATDALSDLQNPLRDALKTGGNLLAVILLCALCDALDETHAIFAVRLGGVLGITLLCANQVHTMIGLAADTLDRIGSFTTLLMPVLSAALTASGGLSSGSALYVGSMLFFDILVRLVRGLLIPLTYAFVAISAAQCALEGNRLEPIRDLIGWVIRNTLKGLMYLFTAYMAVTSVMTGSCDEATVKATSSAIGAAVPVVGSILSEASESVLAGVSLVKSTAGIFGILAIVASGLAPFLEIGSHYLVLKLVAAIGGTIHSGEHSKLLDSLSIAMGYMLAMTGSCILMALLSCCCFMKVVSG